jgi:hypothetical protein
MVLVVISVLAIAGQRASASALPPIPRPMVYGFYDGSAAKCITITRRDDRSVAGYETYIQKTASTFKFQGAARVQQQGGKQFLVFRLNYGRAGMFDVTMTRAFLVIRRDGAPKGQQGTTYWRIPYKTCARWVRDMSRP